MRTFDGEIEVWVLISLILAIGFLVTGSSGFTIAFVFSLNEKQYWANMAPETRSAIKQGCANNDLAEKPKFCSGVKSLLFIIMRYFGFFVHRCRAFSKFHLGSMFPYLEK